MTRNLQNENWSIPLRRVLRAAVLLAALIVSRIFPAAATEVMGRDGGPPNYDSLRFNEDYSYLRKSSLRSDFWDPLKFIPFNSARDIYVSVGGEMRERYEFFSAYNWGAGPQTPDGYWLQRYMLNTDWHLGSHLRIYQEFESSLETGRNGGPRPSIDQDQLEVKQLFGDVSLFNNSLTVRSGRQEMYFGTGKLVSNRETPNTHQNFDGVRMIGLAGPWRVDAFGTRPVMANPGIFDDHEDYARTFWGAYAVRSVPSDKAGGMDLYYLRYTNQNAKFNQGVGDEIRHTIGTRQWGNVGAADYNVEALYQWGRFGTGLIQAWSTALDVGYTAHELPGSPRAGLRSAITSGQRNPKSPNLQTLNPLFPKGSYFGDIGLIGPYNHIDAHPQIEWHLPYRVKLTADCDVFWRESIHDGLYGVSGNLLRPAGTSRASYVGTQPSIEVAWQADRHISFLANYTRFFAGTFLRQSPPASNINYVMTQVAYKF
jgi:hypothetical protein